VEENMSARRAAQVFEQICLRALQQQADAAVARHA
jgi:hypothetical protein